VNSSTLNPNPRRSSVASADEGVDPDNVEMPGESDLL
jgi:hypothetical protein